MKFHSIKKVSMIFYFLLYKDISTLISIQEHKDLGEIISHDLKATTPCNEVAAKYYCALWPLCRSFKCFDDKMFRVLYPTYVRLHLKYCIQAANSCLIKDINPLERIQRVGTKVPYDERSERLNLYPLYPRT